MRVAVLSGRGAGSLVRVLAVLFITHIFVSPCDAIVDVWVEQQKLVRTDGANGDRFGSAVAIDSNYCIIGSDFDDDAADNAGSATVLFYNGSEWVFDQKLIASDAGAGDNFGGAKACAISGTTCIIGAWGDDEKGTDAGAAYIFVHDGSGWTQQAKLVASDGAANDRFGYAVSIDGDYAVVGACFDDDNGSNSGSAYVFFAAAAHGHSRRSYPVRPHTIILARHFLSTEIGRSSEHIRGMVLLATQVRHISTSATPALGRWRRNYGLMMARE